MTYITNKIFNRSIKSALLIATILLLINCNKNEDTPIISEKGISEEIDKVLFKHLKYANDYSNSVWSGYNFASFPKYFIYRETEDSKPSRGFIVDLANIIPNSIKIKDVDSQGLNVYQYDNQITDANNNLQQGNKYYNYNYKINSDGYYIQAYNTSEVNRAMGFSTIEVGFHEVFHKFQDSWELPKTLQDQTNYPINAQLLPLQLMTLKIVEKMPSETNMTNIEKYLSMYVAIRSKEIELDPSDSELVKHMANPQENIEGTAKYVEYTLSKNIFSNFDQSYTILNTSKITNKESVRDNFAFGIWYSTGAAVVYMLKQKKIDVENALKNGKTLYQMAVETLNLTVSQKEDFLNQAKTEFNYDTTITEEANRLLSLK